MKKYLGMILQILLKRMKDVDEVIDDVEHLCNEYDKEGNTCFKWCSKRKINSVSEMVDVLLIVRLVTI